jgi:hypothetical protein
MRCSILAFVGALVLVGAVDAAAQSAEQKNKKHGDPDDLAARWWQQVSSIPLDVNPFFHDTQCSVGQQGDIWNLYSPAPFTATLGDETVAHCTIPAHKQILLSLFAQFCIPYPGETLEEQPAFCATGLDTPLLLRLQIDGKERPRLIERRTSGRFTLVLPDAPNVFSGYPGGSFTTVQDGYFALLPPLAPGDHDVLYQAGVEQDGQTVFFNTRHLLHIEKPADVIVPFDPSATPEP